MTEFYNRYIGPPTYIELEDELEYKLYNINATHLIKYPDGKIIESENDALFYYIDGDRTYSAQKLWRLEKIIYESKI
jgi:type IV secretory pathway VirB4 component